MHPRVVVMGVSGSGKSTLGRSLASALQLRYVEGDDLHPARNVALMAAGNALTDADRHGWLEAIAAVLAAADDGVVVTCSALKRSYRDLLRNAAPDLRLVHLTGSRAVLEHRMGSRVGHYMPAALLQSQLDTLQPPADDEQAVTVDIDQPVARMLAQTLRGLQATGRNVA